mmetsp:Transcript_1248/g.3760  ORF Transcript_1248/g.3760 Transcript_1248/m.3760 type:complete len:684 (-) Transcript_1248:1219-3270(-)
MGADVVDRDVLVKDRGVEDGEEEEEVEEGGEVVGEEGGARVAGEEAKEEEGDGEAGVLVERVEDEDGDAAVAPAAVDEEEALEEAELGDGEVGGVDGLEALVARDADADLGGHDHVDVVRAVADGEGDGGGRDVLMDELDELGLLLGRDAAGDDRAAGGEDAEDDGLERGIAEEVGHGLAVDDECLGRAVRDGGLELLRCPDAAVAVVFVRGRAEDVEAGADEGLVLLVVGEELGGAAHLVEVEEGGLELGGRGLGAQDGERHAGSEELARLADLDGGLALVASEHPELDAGLGERRDRLGHADLELVLDGRGADDGELSLGGVRGAGEEGVAILECDTRGLVVVLVPGLPLVLRVDAVAEDEGAEAFTREVVELEAHVIDPGVALVGGDLEHGVVGALAEEEDAATERCGALARAGAAVECGCATGRGGVGHEGPDIALDGVVLVELLADEDGHALAVVVELVRGEDLPGPAGTADGARLAADDVFGARREPVAGDGGAVDEGALVGRLGLVLDRVALGLDDDGVAEHERLEDEGGEVVAGGDGAFGEGGDGLDVGVGDGALGVLAGGEFELVGGADGFLVGALGDGVGDAVDDEAAELHLVARERAGLVGEDVLDLAEVGDGGGAGERGGVGVLVVHGEVPVDKEGEGLEAELEGDVEREGDEVDVEDEEGAEAPAEVGLL